MLTRTRLAILCLLIAVSVAGIAGPPEQDIANLQKRLDDLRARVDKTLPADAPAAIHLAMRLRYLAWSLARQDPYYWSSGSTDEFAWQLTDVTKYLDKAVAGENIIIPGKTYLMGYLSEIDDTWQAWHLWIPKEYDGKTPLPLMVFLHGWDMFSPWQSGAPGIEGMISVGAQGRGGTDYKFIGEADVLRVIAEARKVVKFDSSRILLTGSSMGGSGTWQVATHYPDVFSGIIPVCGNTDVNVWRSIWDWRTPALSPQRAVRDFLEDDTSPTTYAENLLPLPILAFHGDADPINNVGHGAGMLGRLRSLQHPDCDFYLFPYVGHGISVDWKKAAEHFRPRQIPTKLTWKTAWLKYPGAYWLQVNALGQRLRMATVAAEADIPARVIRARTDNVTEFALLASDLPPGFRPERAVLDNQPLALGAPQQLRRAGNRPDRGPDKGPAQGWVFHATPDGWQPGARPPAADFPPRKDANLEGPVEHAFMTRFLVVTGDGADKPEASPTLKAANAAALDFVAYWKTRFAYPCRIKTAQEVIDEEIDDSNLLLFGGPEENALTARVIKQLPVRFAKNRLALGDKWYGGANVGIKLCYPNPLNSARYVVLVAGTGPDSYRDVNRRFGNWFDWVAFDCRSFFDFAVFDDATNGRQPETFITWGYFNEDWQLDERLTFTKADAWRAAQRPRAPAPKPLSAFLPAAGAAPKCVFLDEVEPLKFDLYKEYIERNRALDGRALLLTGKPYERGLAARFPCTITFPCAGFTRFTATVGLFWDGVTEPCEARKKSELVTLRVTADGKELFKVEEQTWKKAPCEVNIELKGAKELTLHAAGGMFWLNDSVVWANARLLND